METRKALLGHADGDITTHYSAAELEELINVRKRHTFNLPEYGYFLLSISAVFRRAVFAALLNILKFEIKPFGWLIIAIDCDLNDQSQNWRIIIVRIMIMDIMMKMTIRITRVKP